MKRTVDTDEAAAAVGAYSQATTNGDLLFTAGQLPLTPDGELLDDEPIDVQARQSLENVAAILAAEGLEVSDVLKVTVFLDDVEDFAEMNDTYADFFGDSQPARSAIEVGAIPKGAAIEIEAIADAAGD
jgi:reactive intermediate/imine deaminase